MELNALGARVHLICRGESGRGLLLLHGWGCSAEMMQGVQDAFAGNRKTVAVDFPGHGNMGKAAPPPEPWGVPEYCEMTREVIAATGIAPCDIIAHSFGCRVALLLAAKHPELVGKMILTGAAGIRKPANAKQQAKTKAYRTLRSLVNGVEKTHLFGDLPGKWRESLVQRYGSADYAALSPEMRMTFNKVITQDLTPILKEVHASTLLYWGANDTETPLWMGKKMEEEIEDSGLIVEEGAGHFAYLEKLPVFLAIAKNFLTEES